MMLRKLSVIVLGSIFISGAALAQSFDGELRAGSVWGNAAASAAPATDATLTSIFDRALCGTNGGVITRTGGTWGCSTQVVTGTTNALSVGRQGATDPAFAVDTSAGSSATGIKITAAAAAGGVNLAAISSGTNENLTINAKGSGTVSINPTGTGAIALARDTSITGNLTVSGNVSPLGNGPVPEALSANLNQYVRTDGNDTACTGRVDAAYVSGSYPQSCAYLTVQKAIDASLSVNPKGFSVTIFVRAGTRTQALTMNRPLLDGSVLTIQGDTTTPSNVVLNTTSANAFSLSNYAKVIIQGFKVTTTTSGDVFSVASGAQLQIQGKMEYCPCAATGGVFNIGVNGSVSVFSDFTVFGNSGAGGALFAIHTAAPGSSFVSSAITVTHSLTPVYGAYFAGASFGGGADLRNITFAGAATGPRFTVHQNGVIAPPTASLTALPGSTAGTEGSGGIYFMGEANINHDLSLDKGTVSTSTATGTLVVTGTGGVGIGGALNVGGSIKGISRTTQSFLSGSGTYTTPANVTWIRIRMVGGGGGGAPSGTISVAATAGGNTCWNTTGAACTTPVYQAGGGGAGGQGTTSGAGGTVSGSSTCSTAIAGGSGSATNATNAVPGGGGGASFYGGAGGGTMAANGNNAATNSGGGGGGSGQAGAVASGGGGGAGAFCEIRINAPAATYTYAVGAAGTGATSGTAFNGGNGGSGGIWVEEAYGS